MKYEDAFQMKAKFVNNPIGPQGPIPVLFVSETLLRLGFPSDHSHQFLGQLAAVLKGGNRKLLNTIF